MQSLDREQLEAARMDGARGINLFRFVTLPHLARPIAVVVMIETIFLLAVFAEIRITTSGGPGQVTTTLTYLIYMRALLDWDVGGASAGGVLAIVLANLVAIFLVRTIAKGLD
jgi:sorbitol/mannitol transport system permease protein